MTPTLEFTIKTFADLEGKDVVLTLSEEKGDIEGRCIKANEYALVVKSNGRTEIYERREILDYEVVDRSKPKKIVVRYIDEANTERIRQHMADRHCVPIDLIPEDPEKALEMHDKIDHEKLKLGHRHGEKPKRRRRLPVDSSSVAERAALLEGDPTEDPDDDDDFGEESTEEYNGKHWADNG